MMSPAVQFAPRFPVPVLGRALPHPALRRSWVLETTYSQHARLHALGLLRKLKPRRAARVESANYRTVLVELLKELANRFPIQDHVIYAIEVGEWEDEDLPGMAGFIPIEVCGINPWNEELRASLLICFLLANPQDEADTVNLDSLKPHRGWLGPYLIVPEDAPPPGVPRLPRGRTWRKHWDALLELFAYANGSTGYGFLDYDQEALDENGYNTYPEMTLDEIRALERAWQMSKPVLDRVYRLVDYIEQDPRRRLELLARVLRHDKHALAAVTMPRGSNARS